MAQRSSLTVAPALPVTPSSTSLVTPALLALSEPPQSYVDAAAHDYLLIELARTVQESSKVARRRKEFLEEEMRREGLLPPLPVGGAGASAQALGKLKEGVREEVERARVAKAEEEEEESVRSRLEAIGLHVGSNLVEKLCRDRARFADPLDSVKFLCKEIWPAVWDKQVDNLRTNHRGVYVLQDAGFRPLMRLSSPYGAADAIKRSKLHLAFPCGVIRGALARLGLYGTVVAEVTSLPQCTFQIKLPKNS